MIEEFNVGFDVSLETFLSNTSTFDSEYCLDTVFDNVTSLLNKVATYSPGLNAGDTPTALEGLFDVLQQASDFGGALTEFLELVDDGKMPSADLHTRLYMSPLYSLLKTNQHHCNLSH